MEMKWKVVALILSAALYYAACTVLTAWLYGGWGSAGSIARWHSWNASAEMAGIMTVLNLVCWIALLAFRSNGQLLVFGFGAVCLTAVITEVYISLIFQFGDFSPLLTIFGVETASLFEDDTGIVYVIIVAPLMAIISGFIFYFMARLTTRTKRPAQVT